MSKDKPVLVTQNSHKIRELAPLFEDNGVSFDTTDLEKLEIRSDDVEVIARAAAVHAFEVLNRPVIVDDTGLYLSALNGFPGAYAAFALKNIYHSVSSFILSLCPITVSLGDLLARARTYIGLLFIARVRLLME